MCLSGDCMHPGVEAGLGEGGVDVAEVGLAVADAEGKTVDILYTRVRVGVGALGEWHVLIVFRTLALLPGPTDRSRHLAAVRVIDVGALATAVVIVVEDSELSAIDRAQILGESASNDSSQHSVHRSA